MSKKNTIKQVSEKVEIAKIQKSERVQTQLIKATPKILLGIAVTIVAIRGNVQLKDISELVKEMFLSGSVLIGLIVLGILGYIWGFYSRWQLKRSIKSLSEENIELKKRHDLERGTSNLTPEGETSPKDKL